MNSTAKFRNGLVLMTVVLLTLGCQDTSELVPQISSRQAAVEGVERLEYEIRIPRGTCKDTLEAFCRNLKKEGIILAFEPASYDMFGKFVRAEGAFILPDGERQAFSAKKIRLLTISYAKIITPLSYSINYIDASKTYPDLLAM